MTRPSTSLISQSQMSMFKSKHFTPTRLIRYITPKPSASIFTRTFTSSPQYFASSPKMDAFKKAGNRANAPPSHDMVHFPGLMSEKRSFGDFRTVLHTGLFSQVVAMEVPVGGDIGDEVHTVDQILLFTSGRGLATVNGKDQEVKAGDVVVVPAGTQHQFVTKGDQPLELITVYSPAEHLPSSVHKTKEEGDKAEDDGVDEAPEWSLKSKDENVKNGNVSESGKY
ncbi:RmlC-like cupin [Ophiobolus disseminans]|uniref:RmlC-like cupin n=1 Tax=Ophiobolus disseminans TaxID=1469910 RepID=A0A6A6ZRP9_9PLEO|nr:RmlC-like cupin [Ophiobolus disseminans]